MTNGLALNLENVQYHYRLWWDVEHTQIVFMHAAAVKSDNIDELLEYRRLIKKKLKRLTYITREPKV